MPLAVAWHMAPRAAEAARGRAGAAPGMPVLGLLLPAMRPFLGQVTGRHGAVSLLLVGCGVLSPTLVGDNTPQRGWVGWGGGGTCTM